MQSVLDRNDLDELMALVGNMSPYAYGEVIRMYSPWTSNALPLWNPSDLVLARFLHERCWFAAHRFSLLAVHRRRVMFQLPGALDPSPA
jgi:hypothetical protein